ncbi:hypothetical protein M407DRAFT_160421 [Tulasnella calospora MUT 4182]|uniref:Protein kinase domain-containing protein n=1 Tax=Tulasnella calospora MUT 4182 TaxID=1051891 RepID=A0A0C3Q4S0_9AGAM|nr:hypothetical protein M407DRAFT_160421 [Tulasnella calospora MUT 4182]
MFDDHLHVRQETLARQLFALKQGLDTLCSRSPPDGRAVNNPQAGVPRIYTTYITEDKAEQSLRFLRPLTERLPQPLLFVTSADKLVKLVVGNYGTEVHRLLAKHQFAPALYGQRCLESAPTAYVMEFLSPPTLKKSGWVTLFDFFKLKDEDLPTRYANAIRIALDHILDVMQDEKMVHGDLRPNNIMLEVIDSGNTPVCSDEKQGVKLRVVDFDWAEMEHDRRLVQEWMSKRFPSMY